MILTIKLASIGSLLSLNPDINPNQQELSAAGHMWFSISNEIGETESFGYAMTGVVDTDDALYMETNYEFSFSITESQYIELRNFYTSASDFGFNSDDSETGQVSSYDVFTNNCIDFTLTALDVIGLSYPGLDGNTFPQWNSDHMDSIAALIELMVTVNESGASITSSHYKSIIKQVSNSDTPDDAAVNFAAKIAMALGLSPEYSFSDIGSRLSSDMFFGLTTELKGSALDDTPEGIAYRYALESLSPFVIVHNSTTGVSVYDQHNQNGELNAQNYSVEYLQDRLALLQHKNYAYENNQENLNTNESTNPDDTMYIDDASGFYAEVYSANSSNPAFESVVRFGSELSDTNLNGDVNNDRLYGRGGNDTIHGGDGNDYIEGGTGNDTIEGGDGSDTILGGKGADIISGGDEVDYITGGDGYDEISGGNGNDTLSAGDGGGIIFGGNGSDNLVGGSGRDTLIGAADVDLLDSTEDNEDITKGNQFFGGGDFDIIFGTQLMDVYIYREGSDSDEINEVTESLQDYLDIKEIAHTEFEVLLDQFNNVILKRTGTADEITIKGITADSLFTVRFDNGTQWDAEYLFQNAQSPNIYEGNEFDNVIATQSNGDPIEDDYMYGYGANDTLYGYNGIDRLFGGEGNDKLYGGFGEDFLYGGNGNDILYGQNVTTTSDRTDTSGNHYFGGDGNDTLYGTNQSDNYYFYNGDDIDHIYEWQFDSTEITSDTMYFVGQQVDFDKINRSGNDLTISYGNGDKVTIDNWYLSDNYHVESAHFADITLSSEELTNIGLELNTHSIEGQSVNLNGISTYENKLTGGAGLDTLRGGYQSDTLKGMSGNDTLIGSLGADSLYGGAGNDRLYGRLDTGTVMYNDTAGNYYEGGLGSDSLYGTDQSDTYLYNLGDGVDTIYEFNDNLTVTENDILILKGIKLEDVTIEAKSSDLLIRINGTSDYINIDNWYATNQTGYRIEQVKFDNGIMYETELTSEGLHITADSVNENINGVFGYNNTLTGNETENTLTGFNLDDNLLGMGGNDRLLGRDGADTLNGGSGDDRLYGAYDSGTGIYSDTHGNIYIGGQGRDTLYGTNKGDTYIYQLGDGTDYIYEYNDTSELPVADILVFEGIAYSDVSIEGDGYDMLVKINGTSDVVYIDNWYAINKTGYRIEEIQFSDITLTGDELTSDGLHITADSINENIRGVFGYNNTLTGNETENILTGSTLDDRLYGMDGDDTLYGGLGMDTLFGGNGNDKLYGNSNQSSHRYADNAGNIFVGGLGNDYLYGVDEADTYIYNFGDGTDYIYEFSDLSETPQTDVLIFNDISYSDVTIEGIGYDMVIKINGTTDFIQIGSWYAINNTGYRIEEVRFSDLTLTGGELTLEGLSITADTLNEAVNGIFGYDNILTGNDTNNIIEGSNRNDQLNGMAGNDTLYGGLGSDILNGGDGDDIIYGNGTSYGQAGLEDSHGNTYIGGKGNDSLNGTDEADTYIYNFGDGSDVIYERHHTAENLNKDILIFNDISFSDATIEGDDMNLYIRINGTEDQILFKQWYHGSQTYFRIDEVRFTDITLSTDQLTLAGLNKTAYSIDGSLTGHSSYENILTGNDTNNSLTGGFLSDHLYGLGGDDLLYGMQGADYIDGGAGNDTIYGAGPRYGTSHYDDNAGNVIIGGLGDDDIHGTYSADTYIYNLGDGHDVIYDYRSYTEPETTDKLIFNGLSYADVIIENDGHDLIIKDQSQNTLITIKSWYFDTTVDYQIEEIHFVGSIMYKDSITLDGLEKVAYLHNQDLTGISRYENTLVGNNSDNKLYGQGKNDKLYGNGGSDLIDGGGGNDLIYGGTGDDLIYSQKNTLSTDAYGDSMSGGSGDDIITGRDGNDILVGNDGYDRLLGGNGDDILIGADAIIDLGFYSNVSTSDSNGNYFDGGNGNDVLIGSNQSDVYRFTSGGGHDTIYDPSAESLSLNDILSFSSSISKHGFWLDSSGDDLIVSHNTSESSVTIDGWFSNSSSQMDFDINGKTLDSNEVNQLHGMMSVAGSMNQQIKDQIDLMLTTETATTV